MLKMDERLRAELDEDGFTVLESFIQGEELERIRAAVLDVAKHGDGGLVSPIALEMMSYEPVLPYLVAAMGWNIHMRDGLMTNIAPVQEVHVDAGKLCTNWHVDQEEEFQGDGARCEGRRVRPRHTGCARGPRGRCPSPRTSA